MSNYVKEVAIIALVVIEVYALSQGVNGTLMAAVVAGIAGLGGYHLRNKVENGKTSRSTLERAGL